ncbi:hypothetical protein Tco_0648509 [Tanacetum coccineum]
MAPEFWCQTTPTEFWCHGISGAKLYFADVAPLLKFGTKRDENPKGEEAKVNGLMKWYKRIRGLGSHFVGDNLPASVTKRIYQKGKASYERVSSDTVITPISNDNTLFPADEPIVQVPEHMWAANQGLSQNHLSILLSFLSGTMIDQAPEKHHEKIMKLSYSKSYLFDKRKTEFAEDRIDTKMSDKGISFKESSVGVTKNLSYEVVVWSTGIGTHPVIMDFMKQIGQVAAQQGKYLAKCFNRMKECEQMLEGPLRVREYEKQQKSNRIGCGDKSLDLSSFKLSRLFFNLMSSRSSSCWRSYGVQ